MSHKSNAGLNVRVAALFRVFTFRHSSMRLMLAAVLLLFCSPASWAQTNGPADPGRELGAVKDSYSQSGFEDLNLFNGRMNVTVPLLDVVGRGGVKYGVR